MNETLKNELLLLLNENVDIDTLRFLEPKIDVILSNYEIGKKSTD